MDWMEWTEMSIFLKIRAINSASYYCVANSPQVPNIPNKQSGLTRMTTLKNYDYLNGLASISNLNDQRAGVDTHAYTYNNANQRTQMTNLDGEYWSYQYDALGQVTNGAKRWNDASFVAGQQFGYAFDNIGNRTGTMSGGDASGNNLRPTIYNANNLNQYTIRAVPGGYVQITGSANKAATVSMNNLPTERKGAYYHAERPVNNTFGPVYASFTNLAVLNQGTNADLVVTNIGHVFVPQIPEVFT